MGIKISLRNFIDRKEAEMLTPSTLNATAGVHIVCDPSGEDRGTVIVYSNTVNLRYDHKHDAFQSMPGFSYTGTFGAGSCSEYHPIGPKGSCSSTGTTTTVPTSLTINWKLFGDSNGYTIRFTAGPNAGLERKIINNTLGTNSVLTLDTALPTAPTTATQFVILSGTFYGFNAGAKGFAKYDRALNVVTQLSIAGLPATWGTEGQLVGTCKTDTSGFAQGTATGGTVTSLVNSSKVWTTNEWTAFQVRFTSGANAGQVRIIGSNTSTALTLIGSPLPSAVANGDNYILEGDEDKLYLFGNASADVYQYSISSNTWALFCTLPWASGGGMCADWVFDVPSPEWSEEPNVMNGRYIYVFRGSGTSLLCRVDLSARSSASITYVPASDTFNTASSSVYQRGGIYLSKENTGLIFKFDILRNRMVPFTRFIYPNSTATTGDKLWAKVYTDPTNGDEVTWLYTLFHSTNILQRVMMIPD